MNAPQTYDAGFSHQIGRYCDAIRVPPGNNLAATAPADGRVADEEALRRLNHDYIHSDQHGDVARYEEFLAEDFTAQHDGEHREALYTDTYQRRDGKWLCIAGEVVTRGE